MYSNFNVVTLIKIFLPDKGLTVHPFKDLDARCLSCIIIAWIHFIFMDDVTMNFVAVVKPITHYNDLDARMHVFEKFWVKQTNYVDCLI